MQNRPKLCLCRACRRQRDEHVMFGPMKILAEEYIVFLCGKCGDKHCPGALDHLAECHPRKVKHGDNSLNNLILHGSAL
jgi:hypothetical protein